MATGTTTLEFEQTILAAGESVGLAFEQTIAYAAGETGLPFSQAIIQDGETVLGFSQHVFDAAEVSYADWDVLVTVDGVDISDDLTGVVRVEAARNAARIAEFTVILSGAVDLLAWAGKSVAIDYVQEDGAVWRRFTGVIEEPVFNMADKTLHCTCTDELQRTIDGYSNEQLDDLVGSLWSEHVFNSDRLGWDYLQDLLSTSRVSVERLSNGVIVANPWQAQSVADYSYTESSVLDESLSVGLASRQDLKNQIVIQLTASSENLYHKTIRFNWSIGTFCNFSTHELTPPSKTQVREAIESAGWKFVSANYTSLWPDGVYYCSGTPIIFNNLDDEAIIGFAAKAAYRWTQNVDDVYTITVKSQASIAAYGELSETMTASAEFRPEQSGWGGQDDDYTVFPENAVSIGGGILKSSTIDPTALTLAIDTLIAQAVSKMEETHRRNRITFGLPLAPYLELTHTLAVDTGDLVAQGAVSALVEEYDLSQGSAITTVELAISSGQSGLVNTSAAPTSDYVETPVSESSPATVSKAHSLQTYIGGKVDSPAESSDWSGYLVNIGSPVADSETYREGFQFIFDEIDEDLTANLFDDTTQVHTLSVQIPHDLLTITA
jgi:hypothetical protein